MRFEPDESYPACWLRVQKLSMKSTSGLCGKRAEALDPFSMWFAACPLRMQRSFRFSEFLFPIPAKRSGRNRYRFALHDSRGTDESFANCPRRGSEPSEQAATHGFCHVQQF